MRPSLTAAVLAILFLASCIKREAKLIPADNVPNDTLPLTVAILPSLDCLPVYYAQSMGLFDSLGVDIDLREYLSQMDIDTALLRRQVSFGHTNLARLEEMERRDSDTLRVVAEMKEKLFLVTARKRRIRNLSQLKGCMIALDRHDNSDYWSDRITEQAGLELSDIYRPQVNDLRLRTDMLLGALVDAALLPEPYATEARVEGNPEVFATPDSVPGFNCFVITDAPDTARTKAERIREGQVSLFLRAYDEAVGLLNKQPNADTLRAILTRHYGLNDNVIDTLRLPKLPLLRKPSEENRRKAAQWMTDRLNAR